MSLQKFVSYIVGWPKLCVVTYPFESEDERKVGDKPLYSKPGSRANIVRMQGIWNFHTFLRRQQSACLDRENTTPKITAALKDMR